MYKNDDPTATAIGEFTDGDPLNGVPPSVLRSAWVNMIQREMLSLVQGAGIEPNKEQENQLFQAVQKISGNMLEAAKLYAEQLVSEKAQIQIEQETGTAEDAVMSQKAVTEALATALAESGIGTLTPPIVNDPNFQVSGMYRAGSAVLEAFGRPPENDGGMIIAGQASSLNEGHNKHGDSIQILWDGSFLAFRVADKTENGVEPLWGPVRELIHEGNISKFSKPVVYSGDEYVMTTGTPTETPSNVRLPSNYVVTGIRHYYDTSNGPYFQFVSSLIARKLKT